MKKIFYMLFVTVSTLGSCQKDFLERPPLDELVDETFFKTEDQLLLALNGCYAYIKAKNTVDMENLGDNTLNSSQNDNLRISTGNYNVDLGVSLWQICD